MYHVMDAYSFYSFIYFILLIVVSPGLLKTRLRFAVLSDSSPYLGSLKNKVRPNACFRITMIVDQETELFLLTCQDDSCFKIGRVSI